MKPVSVQLYSLRDYTPKDFGGVLQRLAGMGFQGVEPAGFFGHTPAEVRKMADDLGLAVSSTHSPWAQPDNLEEVVEVAGVLGTRFVVCGYGSERFKTIDDIRRTADEAGGMAERLARAGLTLCVHNHWWEFERLGGQLAYDLFMDLCPGLQCELDTYWAANFGAEDPAAQVAKYKRRAPLLHIKDGPLVRDAAHTAVGAGKIDIPGVVAAADPETLQWLVVELDQCDTDMFEAVEASCRYLADKGLGAGR